MKRVRTISIDPTAVPPQLVPLPALGSPPAATQRSGSWDWIDWVNKGGWRSITSDDNTNENPEPKSESSGSDQ